MGDPTVTQDWVKVTIEPLYDVVPIPIGQIYACQGQSIPLQGTNAPTGYTYKWYVLKDEDAKKTFAENSAALNLFETAPQLFNITETANITVTGPGTYFLQCISPNGWKSAVRTLVVQDAIPPNLAATSNSPVEAGNLISLTIGEILPATTYSWTGPNGFAKPERSPTIASATKAMEGTYTVTLNIAGGCSFTATTQVSLANCDIYIQGYDAAGVETFELNRTNANATAQTTTYEPITLKILPFTGTNTFEAYNITWMLNGNPIPLAPKLPTYTVNTPGNYSALLTLKTNANTTCLAEAHLNGKPCKTFTELACGTLPNITLPDIQAAGISLAAGDKFTAGDFTVVITQITSGDPAGYIGTGYVEMKLVAGIIAKKVGIDFTNLVVNTCYEMAAGDVVTQYDPNWGGILDVDELLGLNDLLQKLIEIEKELLDFLPVYSGSESDNNKFDKFISDLNTINDKIQNSPDYDAATKASVQAEIDGLIGNAFCLTNKAPPSGRISALSSNCTFTPWTALAQCIGGAVVGVFVEYSMKWLELIADNNPRHFVNDFTYIKSQIEWNSLVKSAAIGCIFSALPLPTNKVAATLVGAGALEGATEGFATNIINQYNSLKDNHPLTDIPEHIQWQSAFSDAATQGMTQAVLMLVTRNIGQSQKIQSLGKLIVLRVNAMGREVYSSKLKLAGLSDEVINALYAKLGIPLIKSLPSNLVFKTFNNTNKRYNLALLTGRVLSTVTEEAHHIFSQGDSRLIPHWNRLGIDVHDPRFMQWWGRPFHQNNDYAYREMWAAFFRRYPKATLPQVLAEGKRIMAHFGFTVLY